jgi:hypothetical protein
MLAGLHETMKKTKVIYNILGGDPKSVRAPDFLLGDSFALWEL